MDRDDQNLDDLRADTEGVVIYLHRLHDAVPGAVPTDLIMMLEGAVAGGAALAVLAAAVRKAEAKAAVPVAGGRR